jgi:choline dehydrogenase
MIRIDRVSLAMLQAIFLRTGPATSFPTESGAFLKSDPALAVPDIQIHFSLSLGGTRLRLPLLWKIGADRLETEGFQLRMCVLRPKSRGSVTLNVNDPCAAPIIQPNFLGDERDIELLTRTIKIARNIAFQPSLSRYVKAELDPGEDVTSPDKLREYVRREAATPYHPVGTCKMGQDPEAVVDNELKVHGLEGLRIADAAIMPSQIGGNTHAACVMIGEKATDMMLNRPRLPAEYPEA